MSQMIDCRIVAFSGLGGHIVSYGEPVVVSPLKDGMSALPTFSLRSDQAQSLMDQLWHCGLRPTEGTGSAGSLAATQKHLEDMRLLVFNEAGIPDYATRKK